MVQSSFHVPATYDIDLDHVRTLLAQEMPYEDQHEAHELILGSLLLVQEHYGWVSRPSAQIVAQHLRVPSARVYELLTFYGDFRLVPPGEHRIQVCNGTACFALGTPDVQRAIELRYGIANGETTRDGALTFDLVPTCLGVCDLGPLGLFDGKYYPKLSPDTVNDIIEQVVQTPRGGEHHDA
ncbi:MAG: NAD(P)H-dependent oxidoreductase subunit E [Chloroflexi bacterium]|nr:NAD(P)H-dependent oxidoreductase subunit E [Chloroflexota bacterium]